ncbi:MAG: cardiolipin synthase [Eubacteriales bacterium]|jgi:cardiolipin synthase|nr:cardiolipin synthase [Clostridiales bacterium]
MLKKFIRLLLSRRALVILLLILQVWFAVYVIWHAGIRNNLVAMGLTLLSFLVVLYIVNRSDRESFKLSWVIFVLAVPLVGGALYFMFRVQSTAPRKRKAMLQSHQLARGALVQDESVRRELAEVSPSWINQVDYLIDVPGFPVYKNTEVEYFDDGMKYFERLLEVIEQAQRYIFVEVFIIRPGWMWDTLESALTEKARAGLDVRVIYDDMGCFMSVPGNFDKKLRQKGIKCVKFNPFRPFWSTLQNNRDHRKIVVVDGKVALTGGFNFGDEYVGRIRRFGHWKDAGILLRGDAAWSFTVFFLDMWNGSLRTVENIELFRPDRTHQENQDFHADDPPYSSQGYVQPYADSPIDNENTGEHVYRRILSNARKYVYITTPYLILDDTLLSSLELAAKCGVDVRIITPAIPDKRLVHITTRSYYRQLLAAGVRIFEYTPGFIHSKIFISDDVTATVGTVNLDYRSLYLHFECGALLHQVPAIADIKQDFLDTQAKCKEITLENSKVNFLTRAMQIFMRLCSPLM